MATRRPSNPDSEDWAQPVDPRPTVQLVQVEQDEDADPPETSADRVLALLSEAGGDATAKIVLYRMPVNGKKLTWLDEMTPDTFEAGGLKMIRDRWGAGEFELRLYGHNPLTGKYGVRTRQQISLEAALSPLATAPGSSVDHSQLGQLGQILQNMQAQQAQLLQALTERPDPTQSMMQTFTLMKAMREAMGEGPAAQKSSIRELVDAMREMREVSEEFGPQRKDEPDSLLGVAAQLIPAIVGAINQSKGAQVPQVAAPAFPPIEQSQTIDMDAPAQIPPAIPPQPGPAAAPMSPAPTPEQLEADQVNAINQLKLHLTELCKLAPDVEGGVIYVLDNLPDEWLEFLEATPNWFDLLAKVEPFVAPHQAFITAVRNEALRQWNLPD